MLIPAPSWNPTWMRWSRYGTAAVSSGHRGWVNYLAVSPGLRGRGYGRDLMAHGEQLLEARGCPKLNLQLRRGTEALLEFYRAIGYGEDDVASMGKRLIAD